MANKKNIRTIVYTVDGNEKAVEWLGWSIGSVRKHLGTDVRIVVFTDAPRQFGEGVECVDVRDYIKEFGFDVMCDGKTFNGRTVPPMQVFRLALPLMPQLSGCDKVLFLDSDTEVVRPEFGEIFDLHCEDYDCLGALDCPWAKSYNKKKINTLKDMKEWNGLPETSKERLERLEYVNAGVLVMNIRHLQTSHGDYRSFLEKQVSLCVGNDLEQYDQSVINCLWDIGIISNRFNAWNKALDGTEVLRHYVGSEKVNSKVYPPIQYQLLEKTEKPDIVYTVGPVSNHGDLELRWSLRSIAKYGKNVGRIIVTSPVARDWLSDEVIQVDSQDLPNAGYKHHNILKAILDTVDVLDIKGTFFCSSDDHFYIKDTDFENQPLSAQGWVIPNDVGSSNNVKTAIWKQSCVDTRQYLVENGLSTVNFQLHRNSKWNGNLVRQNRGFFTAALSMRFCVEPHVLMQNIWISCQPDTEVVFRKDFKVHSMWGIPNDCDCISCFDDAFEDEGFLKFMNREFGEKCRYEK